MQEVGETTPFRWILTAAQPHWGWLSLSIFAGGIMAGCEIAGVHLIKLLVDSALGKESQQLLPILGLAVTLMGVSALSRYLRTYASGKAEAIFFCRLRRDLVDHLTRLPLAAIKRRHSTDLLSRLYEDTGEIARFVGNISDYIYKMLFLILSLVYLLSIDWKIALLTCAFVILAAFFAERYSRPMVDHSREYQARIAESNGLLKDAVMGIDVLKAYNIEDSLLAKYKRKLDAALILSLKMAGQFARSISISNLSQSIPLLLCIFYGAFQVMKKALAPSQLVAYIQLVARLIGPTRDLPKMIFAVKKAEGLAQRIMELHSEEIERTGGKTTAPVADEYAIEFKEVTFGYGGDPVLRNISFKIPMGKKSAIVGKSGCGKSTILNLISGLYADYEGEIQVCGRSVEEWDLESLRSQLSVVLQDTYLFPGTVAENIRYGNMETEYEEIVEVSRTAMVHGFVEELAEGYQADLGERGGSLSVGQRQRLALARALLKDAPVLLLDEPTSALDLQTEAELLESLHRKTADKTLVIVTHRISTVIDADAILVLDRGRLAGQGTHAELREGNAVYRDLHLEQEEIAEGRSM